MDGLHHILHGIELDGLGHLDFRHEAQRQILLYDSIATGEEAENPLDEMLFLLLEGDPVLHVLGQIELLGLPEHRHVLLVFGPEIGVLNGKDDVAMRVCLQHGFFGLPLAAL